MDQNLQQALDEFLRNQDEDRATLDDFLARYPEHRLTLHTLLRTIDERPPAPQLPQASLAPPYPDPPSSRQATKSVPASFPPPSGEPAWLTALFTREERSASRLRIPVVPLSLAAVLTVMLILAFSILFLQVWPKMNVAQTATLEEIAGVVEIRPAGGGDWRPALRGEEVRAGDRLRTGDRASATLVFFDGSRSVLESATEVTIAQLQAQRNGGNRVIALIQWVGQTHNRVRPSSGAASYFAIETPAATATVRGTEFILRVEPDSATFISVIEGAVDVAAQGVTMEMLAGQATVIRAEPSPTPTYVLPTPTATVSSAATRAATPDATQTPTPPPSTQTPAPPPSTQTPAPPPSTQTPTPPPSTQTPAPPQSTQTPAPPPPTQTPAPPPPTQTPAPPPPTQTPAPPPPTQTPAPPPPTQTPAPPEPTKSHEPPGQTKTPEPPGHNKTPKP